MDWPLFAMVTYCFALVLIIVLIVLRSRRDVKKQYARLLEEKETKLARMQIDAEEAMEALDAYAGQLRDDWKKMRSDDHEALRRLHVREIDLEAAVLAMKARVTALEVQLRGMQRSEKHEAYAPVQFAPPPDPPAAPLPDTPAGAAHPAPPDTPAQQMPEPAQDAKPPGGLTQSAEKLVIPEAQLTQAQADTQAGADKQADAVTHAHAHTQVDVDTQVNVDMQAQADTQAAADTETGAHTQAAADAGTGAHTQAYEKSDAGGDAETITCMALHEDDEAGIDAQADTQARARALFEAGTDVSEAARALGLPYHGVRLMFAAFKKEPVPQKRDEDTRTRARAMLADGAEISEIAKSLEISISEVALLSANAAKTISEGASPARV